jgi:hypothetical protein
LKILLIIQKGTEIGDSRHREHIINLNRVCSLTPSQAKGYDLKLDFPVNRRISIARNHLVKVRKSLGV